MKATPEMQEKIIKHLAIHAKMLLAPEITLSPQNQYRNVCRWIHGFYESISLLNDMGIVNWQEERKIQRETIDKILHLDNVSKENVYKILDSTFTKRGPESHTSDDSECPNKNNH